MKAWLKSALYGVASALQAAGKALGARLDDLSNSRLRATLSRTPNYFFSHDYTSTNEPVWQRYLAPFRGKPGVKLLEVGSYQGRSTIWFLEQVLTHATASITCVDPFSYEGREIAFDHNISVSGHSAKVVKRKGTSEVVLPTLSAERFDIVYIDGSHYAPNVLFDAFLTWGLLKDGGIIIFDDYEWEPDRPPERRPKMAIDVFLAVLKPQIDVLHKEYQVIVRARPGTRSTAAAA